MSTDKSEATRLADALDAYGETTQAESNLRAKVSALLRRWPDAGEPVAWLVEGWHDGKLIARIPHLTVDEAKASAAVFSQHYTTTKTVPLYTAPLDQSERIAALESAREVQDAALAVARSDFRELALRAEKLEAALAERDRVIEIAQEMAEYLRNSSICQADTEAAEEVIRAIEEVRRGQI